MSQKTQILFHIHGLLMLLRPINSLMMGVAVFIGEFIAAGGLPSFSEILYGFLVGFFLTAATMAVNDYYDIEIDRINDPQRPLPSGAVSLKEALTVGLILTGLGIIFAALTNLQAFTVVFVALILMIYYNIRGKRTGFFGNIIVSICVALPFLYGGAVIGRISYLLILFSLMAFFANTGREVIKGISDIKGDKTRRVKTLAILFGNVTASRISIGLFTLSIIISLFPLLMGLISMLYLPFIALSDLGFIWSSFEILKDPSPSKAKNVKKRVLIWMLLGLIGFITGSIKI
ncbi:UbiA family prenyltransferase [[Eubacterium] cellulosolvens]